MKSLPKDSVEIKAYLKQLNDSHKRKVIWNKGLTKEMDSRLDYERPTKFKKGQVSVFKGKHHTKEANKKNRQAHLEKHFSPQTEFKKAMTPWNKNKKGCFRHTKEWKEEQSQRNKANPIKYWENKHFCKEHRDKIGKAISGKNNPNWADGKSFETYTKEFNKQLKELIRQRDNHQCQKCGCPEIENMERLSVHHIDYDKKNCLPSNLISLCRGCNGEVNSNRKYWTKYFQEKLSKEMTYYG